MANKELKTINIRFEKKHIIMGVITFILFFMSMYLFPEHFGFNEYKLVHCTDGTTELFNESNWIYCGEDIRLSSVYIEDFK